MEAADGDGDEFRALLVARSKTATPGDKAVVSGTFSKVVREGVRGELTSASLKVFLKKYKHARSHLGKAARPGDEAELEMINLLAFTDPAVRETYEIHSSNKNPTNLESAVTVLKGILNRRVRHLTAHRHRRITAVVIHHHRTAVMRDRLGQLAHRRARHAR